MEKNPNKIVIVNCIIIFILLGNIYGMLGTWQIRFNNNAFSRLPYFSNLFYIYGVFRNVQTQNREFMAFGSFQTRDSIPMEPTKDMVDLSMQDYFPQSHGESNLRMDYQRIANQPDRIKAKYRQIATSINNMYNKKHPGKPISRVFIYQYYWPTDPMGYYHRFNEARILYLGSN
jgi:hypothetical protein